MDIDGYNGSELASINDNTPIDNSLTANMDQMFDITTSKNINIDNQNIYMDNQNNNMEKYVENMDNDNMNNEDNKNMFIENMESSTASSTTNSTASSTTNSTASSTSGSTASSTASRTASSTSNTMTGFGIFLIIWIVIGIIAFIISLFCFGFSGSITEKIIGLLLAIFFGPFYFIYFYFNKNYCGKKTNNSSE